MRIPIFGTGLGLCSMALLSACALSPAPISEAEQRSQARLDLRQMFVGQEPIEGPMGFYQAMARALKYNLEHRLQMMEQSLADERVVDARLDLLPRLVATNDYYGRSNELASSSESFFTGEESLEASISSQRTGERSDITLAWNLLDFGVSYVRAAQEANRALISRERRAKVVQDLMVDVRRAYWQARGAERLIPEVDQLLLEVRGALRDTATLDAEGLLEPFEALDFQRVLIEKAGELRELRRRLELAQIELAALTNTPPGRGIVLAAQGIDELPVPRVDLPVGELEILALSTRPELKELGYEHRIGHLEVKRAMLSMLPGIEIGYGMNEDDNDFLVHNDWFSWSALISKNLIEIISAPQKIRMARSDLEIVETRRLATSMAVLAQVRVAHYDYLASADALSLARRAHEVENRVYEVTSGRVDGESQSELELIRRAASGLVWKLNYHRAYAHLQEAYGRLLNSVGVLPPLSEADVKDIATLTDRIRGALEHWGEHPAPLQASTTGYGG